MTLFLKSCMLFCCFTQILAQGNFDVLQYVDQLIGTTNGGNVFAGASLPFGMAKAVADVDGDNTGGFATDGSNVTGFSTMHDSGTGSTSSLGNFPLFPYAGCPGDEIDGCRYPKLERRIGSINSSVKASPGHFSISLASNINVDMTVSHHTSLFRFQFPIDPVDGSTLSPLILLDLTDLSDSRFNGAVSVEGESGKMTGNATFAPSFGSGTYTLYFCTEFQGSPVRDNGIFVNSRAGTDPKDLFITKGINGYPLPGGAFVRFEAPPANNPILARVGVSFVNNTQACGNAEREIPDWDFDATKRAAEDAWRTKLSPISVKPGNGTSEAIQTIFWSGIYRTMINPQDYTGENPLWNSTEPYFDSFYCLWDSFRSQLPFLAIFDPNSLSRMVRSLLDTFKNLGWLPDCRMSLCKGFTQGGSNADNVVVDAFIKNLTGNIDWDLAYQAVVNDAENEPLDWSNEGRGGLMSWKNLGYIPAEDFDYIGFGTFTKSISRTLEYAYNDFVISSMAQRMGKDADAEKYSRRSENWKNLYKADQTSSINGVDTGFTGFFQPKYLNQTFGYQDPVLCSNLLDGTCSLQNTAHETFESSIWEYSFFVPGDMASLITAFGGPETFVRRLDYLHESGLNYIGNEPSFLTVFQYHYAGRPGRSSYRSHTYIPSSFNTFTDGIPGNDDSGAMGSFIALSMMGLFPNPGQDVYLIIPPYFESVAITNGITGKTATISNINFDSAYQNIYVQRATLDGIPYTKNWIDHSFFLEGKNLTLYLGRNESSWGTTNADLPPSLSTMVGDLNFKGF
ncbi:MAG: hypothetical protein M1837_006201 [Sclerophora amabilis]|nr:MAG: hypothetical protein M1837_006201 [Sclerophora amabilis]